MGPHFGEEPPISGTKGSGAVFLTGCSLRCRFCQNYQISQGGLGAVTDTLRLFSVLIRMVREHGVHNVNFVTPDHFFPHIFRVVALLRAEGLTLPILYNLSGYQSVDMLRTAEAYSDIYLPDFKYADASLAQNLSGCPDYPMVALEAIDEMLHQKGFLDACAEGRGIAKRGVLVRHLVLPGHTENSVRVLTSLFLEFGPDLPISLMSQYHPVRPMREDSMNRCVRREEFDTVWEHARSLGFRYLFVQFPKKTARPEAPASPFLPDFRREDPFGRNGAETHPQKDG
jgi:putative pyruvate formate lyase activating enzyme